MQNIINTISGLSPIIAAIILVVDRRLLCVKKSRPILIPHHVEQAHKVKSSYILEKRSIFQKSWFVLLLSLLCMAYALPEVLIPGELTGFSVYKIVVGVGMFFFVLLQSSIYGILDTIYLFKSEDLKLIRAILDEFKKP